MILFLSNGKAFVKKIGSEALPQAAPFNRCQNERGRSSSNEHN